MKNRNFILFYLNGERQQVEGATAGLMLSEYLRKIKNLPGTKIVCAEGDCGACSVLRLFPLTSGKNKDLFQPINSCISTVSQMDGSMLVTVEALAGAAETKDKFSNPENKFELSVVQKAMLQCHGSQCGFCTPGFVVALTGLVEKKLRDKATQVTLTSQEVKNQLTGNLCRCTGYQPIIDAGTSIQLKDCETVNKRFSTRAQQQDLLKHLKIPILIQTESFHLFAPCDMKQAITYFKKNKAVQIIGAATDLGVVHNKRKMQLINLLSLHLIPELYEIKKVAPGRISVGARVTLSELRNFTKSSIPEFSKFLDLFASPQIKNVATLVGNVATASPIADTPPFLLIMNTSVEISGPKGLRSMPLEKFFISYRKTGLQPQEIITALHFDIPKKNEVMALYKVSQRKDMDISAVNFAARFCWNNETKTKIKAIQIAIGGVAATTLRLRKTEAGLLGKPYRAELITTAVENLHSEIAPYSDLRGSSSFRHVLAENLLQKFFREKIL